MSKYTSSASSSQIAHITPQTTRIRRIIIEKTIPNEHAVQCALCTKTSTIEAKIGLDKPKETCLLLIAYHSSPQ